MEQEPQGNSLKEYFVDYFSLLWNGTCNVWCRAHFLVFEARAIMVIISTTRHLFNS